MSNLQNLKEIVLATYQKSTEDFAQWMIKNHLPENKNYNEYLEWVKEKLERDFHDKIFFEEVKKDVRDRYEALKEVFLR